MTAARICARTLCVAWLCSAPTAQAAGFTLEQVLSAPFTSEVAAAPAGHSFAWVSESRGRRNVWLGVAAGGEVRERALTRYEADDGQDIADLAFVPHHPLLLYVRGGDFEFPDKPAPNPTHETSEIAQSVYLVDFLGHEPVKLGDGHAPLPAPAGDRILYLHEGKVFSVAPVKGAKPQQLFRVRGNVDSLRFSPDGSRLAFVCLRGDHSFVGVYTFATQTLSWVDASFAFDFEPTWSPDGTRVAFIRTPSRHDEVGLVAHRTGDPWSIGVANLASQAVSEAYRAPHGPGSVFHGLSSEAQLYWSGEQLVFPGEKDGWLHLYAVPAAGGAARLLTPGEFEIEYAAATRDGGSIVYAGNAGDIDRRHLWRLRVADGAIEQLTRGTGIETQPAVLADGSVAFKRSDAHVPAHAALWQPGRPLRELMAEGVPADFPAAALVEPQSLQLPQRAGLAAHAQLFLPAAAAPGARHPAVIFTHGGPIRQMLVGWHYRGYYSNAYAFNQYLASRGYVVLSLNYRAGIGYGLDYREADGIGADGASEYNDLLAAADYLRARPDVDPARLGLWGGSYGGYMTALGLARNSDLFKAGVDMHGVHDWYHWLLATDHNNLPFYYLDAPPPVLATALAASPIGAISGWRSPVLLVQGDDDHNVAFSESVRLAEALRKQGVDYSELVLPDEIHGFLRQASWLRAYGAASLFLDAHLGPTP